MQLQVGLIRSVTARVKTGCCFCLFVCGFTSHSRIFTHLDFTIIGVALKVLSYTQHLSSKGSKACETGHPFMSHLLPSV